MLTHRDCERQYSITAGHTLIREHPAYKLSAAIKRKEKSVGQVVQFKDYQQPAVEVSAEVEETCLVPIQFGVGFQETKLCLEKLETYGIDSLHSRTLKNHRDASVHLMKAEDAIWLNKKILENESLSDQVFRSRVDLIQMLENVDPSLMRGIWESFSINSVDLNHDQAREHTDPAPAS